MNLESVNFDWYHQRANVHAILILVILLLLLLPTLSAYTICYSTTLRVDGQQETLITNSQKNRHPALAKSPSPPQSRHHQGPIAINAPATSISDGTVPSQQVHFLYISFFCARAHFSAQFRKFPPFFFFHLFIFLVVMTRMRFLPTSQKGKRGA